MTPGHLLFALKYQIEILAATALSILVMFVCVCRKNITFIRNCIILSPFFSIMEQNSVTMNLQRLQYVGEFERFMKFFPSEQVFKSVK